MPLKWMRLLLASLVVILLVGCSSKEDRIAEGLENAKVIFQDDAQMPNDKVNDTKIFLPSGFSIEDADESNILLTKGKDSYVLFINPNELPTSQLYYELMLADPNLKIVEKSTFEQNERFGFAAVIENSEEKYELITSIGGMKLTTISKESDIASNMEKMMMIVRSIPID